MADNVIAYKDLADILIRLPFAHRGLHTDDQNVPENSMLSFTRAMQQGFAIELDVQLSADGKVIVFHDDDLLRMTGIDRKTVNTNFKQLQEISLRNSNQGIPLLEDVLSLVNGKTPLLIELKNFGRAGRLEKKVLEILKNYPGPYAIQSFNPFTVRYFKKNAPGIMRGQLAGSFDGEALPLGLKFLLKYLLLNFLGSPHFVAYESGALPEWLARRQKRKNILILIWTVRSQQEADNLPPYIDNIIFELFIPAGPFKKNMNLPYGEKE